MNKIKKFSAWFIATAGGAGFAPKAPGTAGTVVGIPLAYLTYDWAIGPKLIFWSALLAAGIWAAKQIDEMQGSSDNQKIVMDEVVGYGITAWTAGPHLWTIVCAFVLFRIFDVIKPPPIRQLDYWSKKKAADKSSQVAAWYGGFGVMADDVLAGFEALAIVLILQKLAVIS